MSIINDEQAEIVCKSDDLQDSSLSQYDFSHLYRSHQDQMDYEWYRKHISTRSNGVCYQWYPQKIDQV